METWLLEILSHLVTFHKGTFHVHVDVNIELRSAFYRSADCRNRLVCLFVCLDFYIPLKNIIIGAQKDTNWYCNPHRRGMGWRSNFTALLSVFLGSLQLYLFNLNQNNDDAKTDCLKASNLNNQSFFFISIKRSCNLIIFVLQMFTYSSSFQKYTKSHFIAPIP